VTSSRAWSIHGDPASSLGELGDLAPSDPEHARDLTRREDGGHGQARQICALFLAPDGQVDRGRDGELMLASTVRESAIYY
jgi:hypothetical protein